MICLITLSALPAYLSAASVDGGRVRGWPAYQHLPPSWHPHPSLPHHRHPGGRPMRGMSGMRTWTWTQHDSMLKSEREHIFHAFFLNMPFSNIWRPCNKKPHNYSIPVTWNPYARTFGCEEAPESEEAAPGSWRVEGGWNTERGSKPEDRVAFSFSVAAPHPVGMTLIFNVSGRARPIFEI